VIEQLKTFLGKNFMRFVLALVWSGFAMWTIAFLLTSNLTGSAEEYGDTILGFVMGSVIGVVMQFYFGSSQSSSEKNDLIKDGQR